MATASSRRELGEERGGKGRGGEGREGRGGEGREGRGGEGMRMKMSRLEA